MQLHAATAVIFIIVLPGELDVFVVIDSVGDGLLDAAWGVGVALDIGVSGVDCGVDVVRGVDVGGWGVEVRVGKGVCAGL
jgi:hypothetical protein